MGSSNGLISEVDLRLTPASERLVQHFTVARGEVRQRGTLEIARSWHTDSNRGTLGKQFPSGWFGSYARGSADTTESSARSISILRIGNTTFMDLQIPSTAFYETLTDGSVVGCVLNAERTRLLYVVNQSTGVSLGLLPARGPADILKRWGLILAAVLSIWGLMLISRSSMGGVVRVAIAVIAAAAARIGAIASFRSREIFEQAVGMAQTK